MSFFLFYVFTHPLHYFELVASGSLLTVIAYVKGFLFVLFLSVKRQFVVGQLELVILAEIDVFDEVIDLLLQLSDAQVLAGQITKHLVGVFTLMLQSFLGVLANLMKRARISALQKVL